MLEAYQAFGDYESMMELVESMVKHVAQKVLGTLEIEYKQEAIIAGLIDQAVSRIEDLAAETFKEQIRLEQVELDDEFKTTVASARQSLMLCRSEIGKKSIHEISERAFQETLFTVAMLTKFLVKIKGIQTKDKPSVRRLAEGTLAGFNKIINSFHAHKEPRFIDLARPWKRVKYKDLVRDWCKNQLHEFGDWFALTPEKRREIAVEIFGVEIGPDFEDFEVTNAVFSKHIEPTLIQPTFVTHLPKELVPLAKLSPDDPTTVEVFECCINGQEIAPAYTEQNDPIEQRERLEHQAGGEQQKLDEDFLVALEHGMPPAGGMGMGIDRLCMMLLGQESIRDVILFPQLKPK
jgi:lysyl-tRNA synthetase class 2